MNIQHLTVLFCIVFYGAAALGCLFAAGVLTIAQNITLQLYVVCYSVPSSPECIWSRYPNQSSTYGFACVHCVLLCMSESTTDVPIIIRSRTVLCCIVFHRVNVYSVVATRVPINVQTQLGHLTCLYCPFSFGWEGP